MGPRQTGELGEDQDSNLQDQDENQCTRSQDLKDQYYTRQTLLTFKTNEQNRTKIKPQNCGHWPIIIPTASPILSICGVV